jgi:Cysteine rich repeat
MTARATFLLTTIVAVAFFTIAAIPSAVLAQQDIVAACTSDVAAQCAGHQLGEGRAACVKTRFKSFSLPCRLALVRMAAVRRACKADVKKSCADVRPGGGRIETCLKDHFEELSDGCQETISHATGIN